MQSLNGTSQILPFGTLKSLVFSKAISSNLSHFFVHCPLFKDKRITLLSTLNKIDCKLIETSESSLIETLLFGNSLFDLKKNSLILNASIDYILSTKRFEEVLLQQVLITTTKYSCRSNHSFILSEFFNLSYLYLDLVTFTFVLLFPSTARIFWGLVIVIFSLLVVVY